MKSVSDKGIFGKKVGMTRIFTEDGDFVPVTVLELGPNTVYQVKSKATDGYDALQVGYGKKKPQRVNRPQTGHFAVSQKGAPEFSGEIRIKNTEELPSVGDEITLEGLFEAGDKVDVVGTSVGKGFAGVIKRHGMKGAATDSHGTHEYFRHGGSIGCRKFPGRVWKNKRMAGHMGDIRVMQQGLEVVTVKHEDNLLFVKGSVPGSKNGRIFVRTSIKS